MVDLKQGVVRGRFLLFFLSLVLFTGFWKFLEPGINYRFFYTHSDQHLILCMQQTLYSIYIPGSDSMM